MKLNNKIAIVTGASSGMGREIALLFAKEGAKVVAFARRKERLDEIAKDVGDDRGEIVPFRGDLAKDEDVKGVVEFAIKELGGIDILVNNAGIMDAMTPVADVSDELWDNVINMNLTSLMKMTRSTLKYMLEKESGNIVNVASVGGLMGARAGAAYAASKHGVIGLTKNTGFMYANKGIRCNAICPGGVETEIGLGGTAPNQFGLDRVMTGMALNPRIGKPEEIARVALFLASDDSSFVNGTTVTADSGWIAY